MSRFVLLRRVWCRPAVRRVAPLWEFRSAGFDASRPSQGGYPFRGHGCAYLFKYEFVLVPSVRASLLRSRCSSRHVSFCPSVRSCRSSFPFFLFFFNLFRSSLLFSPTHMTSSCMLVISWGLLKGILFLFPFPRCPEKFSLFFFRFLCCVVSSVQSSFLTPHSASVLS